MSGSIGWAIGLDVHRDFCEVAICEAGTVRSAGPIETSPDVHELFARSLGCGDRVALEVTGGGRGRSPGSSSRTCAGWSW